MVQPGLSGRGRGDGTSGLDARDFQYTVHVESQPTDPGMLVWHICVIKMDIIVDTRWATIPRLPDILEDPGSLVEKPVSLPRKTRVVGTTM